MKRMQVLLAALLLLMGTWFLGVRAYGEENDPQTKAAGDYEYELLDDGTAEIVRYNGSAAYLTVPETIGEYEVTSIGRFAFTGCGSLRTITLPETIETITSNPFAGCSRLHTIKLSGESKYLEVVDGLLYHKKDRRLICCPTDMRAPGTVEVAEKTREIGDFAFFQCERIAGIQLPESVERIGASAFKHCEKLGELNFPEHLKSVGSSAFEACGALAGADLPEGLQSIGADAFRSCTGLTYVQIPDSLKVIEGNPFVDCTGLTEIRISSEHPVFAVLNQALLNISDGTLVCYPAGLPDMEWELPGEVQVIGAYAFFNCRNLAHVYMTEGLTEIRDSAFAGCSGLENVELPAGTRSIGSFAFEYCERLNSIGLPEGLETIGSNAFSLCGRLTEVDLPEGLSYLGDDAFAFCSSLSRIQLPDSLTEIDTNPFTYCISLREIQVSSEHPVFAVMNHVLFNMEEKTLVCYPAGLLTRVYQVPEEIERIGEFAFYNCGGLQSLYLTEGVTEIADNAFDYCVNLRRARLPRSVTEIGNNAFGHCGNCVFLVPEGSIAAEYCEENELKFKYRKMKE